MSTYTVRSFRLKTIVLTTDFDAVFADEAADGFCNLSRQPVDAIGVAEVLERQYECDEGDEVLIDSYRFETVVALQLCGGSWEICDEACNYWGMIRRGDPIPPKCYGQLDRSRFKLRSAEPKSDHHSLPIEPAWLTRLANAKGEHSMSDFAAHEIAEYVRGLREAAWPIIRELEIAGDDTSWRDGDETDRVYPWYEIEPLKKAVLGKSATPA